MERMSVTTTETQLPRTQEEFDIVFAEITASMEDTEADTSVKSVIEANYDPDAPTDETIDNPRARRSRNFLTL